MSEEQKYIGICCSAINKEPVKPIVDHMVERISGSGRRCLIYHCFEDFSVDVERNYGARSVFGVINFAVLDAMIIFAESIHDKDAAGIIAKKCAEHGVPVISVDGETEGAHNVLFDYGDSFGKVVEHVLTVHGCRRIKFMAGIPENDFSQVRIDRCREIMKSHGLTLREEDVLYGYFWEGPTLTETEKIIDSGEPLPDAIICANDSMAMAVCTKLNERGYSVPEDCIVTGFDGIETEKYHTPRLTNAIRDNKQIANAVLDMAEKLIERPDDPAVGDLVIEYIPVFSESCGCRERDSVSRNMLLTDFVNNYSGRQEYEEHIDRMSNSIASDPAPDNVINVLRRYAFGNSALCVTESFMRFIGGKTKGDEVEKTSYPQRMCVFCSTYYDKSQTENAEISSDELLPDMAHAFGDLNTLVVLPVHFQSLVIGYFVTPYVLQGRHNDYLYTFNMALNRSLETMRLHAHMLALNRRLEFLFTHDQLTGIYNRYGFYDRFKKSISEKDGLAVFIVSADLNDMKYINDTFGHAAGDNALNIVAGALSGAAEQAAEFASMEWRGGADVFCARFGGDEFVVAGVCRLSAQETADFFRDRFYMELKRLNESSGNPYEVHVGLGLYAARLPEDMGDDDADKVDALIELADKLMYSDKAKHKRHPRS